LRRAELSFNARALLASLLVASLCACAGAKPAATSSSPNAAPPFDLASCKTHELAAVRPIVNKRCTSCHSPQGMAGEDYDWTQDSAISAHRANVAAQVEQGTMPPSGYPPLNAEERQLLLCWAKQ
jgi:uncharacterized membrane protein